MILMILIIFIIGIRNIKSILMKFDNNNIIEKYKYNNSYIIIKIQEIYIEMNRYIKLNKLNK